MESQQESIVLGNEIAQGPSKVGLRRRAFRSHGNLDNRFTHDPEFLDRQRKVKG